MSGAERAATAGGGLRHTAHLLLAGLVFAGSLWAQDHRLGINPWQMNLYLRTVDAVAESQVGSIRVDLPWQQVEPNPGEFHWQLLDQVVERAAAHGADVLLTLRAISSWGTGHDAAEDEYHGASLPLDLGAWEAFVTSLAERYRGRQVAYEIENEPDSAFWSGTMEQYLTLLRASFRALLRGDPDARVVSGALACHIVFDLSRPLQQRRQRTEFDAWQRAILATHAFNVIGVHDYYFPDHAVNGWTFASYLQHIQELARASGCRDCPVWITETGFVSRSERAGARVDAGTPEQQARWARAALEQAFAAGVARVYWLFLRDHPDTGYFASMGLLDAAGGHRPVFAVLAPK
jgi:hypothetical protein